MPTIQLYLHPIIEKRKTNITGKIASPMENPIIESDNALPLFLPYHLPIATAGIWISIPCPKNLKPKIIIGKYQIRFTKVMVKQSKLSDIITTLIFRVILYLSM